MAENKWIIWGYDLIYRGVMTPFMTGRAHLATVVWSFE